MSKMSQEAGDASSKTGGNLDHVILDLKWMTVVLYWKQYKIADTRYRGLVGTGTGFFFSPGWEGPKNPCPLFRAEIQVSNSNGMTHAIGGRHPMRSPSWVVWEFHPLKKLTSANYPA